MNILIKGTLWKISFATPECMTPYNKKYNKEEVVYLSEAGGEHVEVFNQPYIISPMEDKAYICRVLTRTGLLRSWSIKISAVGSRSIILSKCAPFDQPA